jgi:hypothetical protein
LTNGKIDMTQYCPKCFRPMTVNKYDKDVYLCYNSHYDGQGAFIDLNPSNDRALKISLGRELTSDERRKIKFPSEYE